LGLRFRKSFIPYDAFLIHIPSNAKLDSYFVSFPFMAYWLDKDFNILHCDYCFPNNVFDVIPNQVFVLELPLGVVE
jgi:uncharacterized membrane protein (UPF0127 family)